MTIYKPTKKSRLGILALVFFLYCLGSCSKHNSINGNVTPAVTENDTLMAWQKITRTSKNAEDIWFVNPAKGFLCDSGGIYSSSDSGKTWLQASGLLNHSYNLFFLNPQIGASVGPQDLYVTLNGGASWSRRSIPVNTTDPISAIDIQFTSPSTAWLSSPNGLFKTTDTCNTWNNVFQYDVNGLFFFNDNAGLIYRPTGSLPVGVNQTLDGGAHWQQISNISGNLGSYIMQFTDQMHGWLTVGNSLYGTTDGGITWTIKLTTTSPSYSNFLSDVQFLDSQTGYIARYKEIIKTTDGGQTWTRNCKIGNGYVVEIFFLDANTGWACCSDGSILRLKQ